MLVPLNLKLLKVKKRKHKSKPNKLMVDGYSSSSFSTYLKIHWIILLKTLILRRILENSWVSCSIISPGFPQDLPDLLSLVSQETKLESIDDSTIRFLWPNNFAAFVTNGFVGASAVSFGSLFDYDQGVHMDGVWVDSPDNIKVVALIILRLDLRKVITTGPLSITPFSISFLLRMLVYSNPPFLGKKSRMQFGIVPGLRPSVPTASTLASSNPFGKLLSLIFGVVTNILNLLARLQMV
nr:hypothetical protein [Tanacetum cinerariifolium]